MNPIKVTVVYAHPCRQAVREVLLEPSTPLIGALKASGLLEEFPDIDLSVSRTGIFGRLAALDAPLQDGDRVEIYRPLAATPNELRRRRARGGRSR